VAAAATPASTTAARARVLTGQAGTALQVDENFDRAWRRVGSSLDRHGFTVEDRDRSTGTYFVRYADPRFAGKEDPGFFSKLFGSAGNEGAPARYRVNVKGDGERAIVTVLNAQGAAESGEAGQRIVSLLLEDLR
jgi:outer membrane protein assembly factor BamC